MHPWWKLHPSVRTVGRSGAVMFIDQLRRLGFSLERAESKSKRSKRNVVLTDAELEWIAEDEHKQWCEQKMSLGWVYGPERDYVKLTHPFLCNWSELSALGKDFERDAVRGVLAVIATAGFKLVRPPA